VNERLRRLVPPALRRAVARRLGRPVVAPPGKVHFGDLRRTTPISADFGYGRGGPVDRHYVEAFLELHSDDIRGRVLEVGDASYTRHFGGDRVTRADVLHVDEGAPEATFVGDLADGAFLPEGAFDCIVLTQTLHLIYDFPAALRTLARVLAPGGVLLLTVPGISNVAGDEWGATWHYSFTDHALRRAAGEAFAGWDVNVTSHGNVLAAVAFLHGLGRGELTAAELDVVHVEYAIVHALRAVKPE
jgi:SAM-dependent methyltransferase